MQRLRDQALQNLLALLSVPSFLALAGAALWTNYRVFAVSSFAVAGISLVLWLMLFAYWLGARTQEHPVSAQGLTASPSGDGNVAQQGASADHAVQQIIQGANSPAMGNVENSTVIVSIGDAADDVAPTVEARDVVKAGWISVRNTGKADEFSIEISDFFHPGVGFLEGQWVRSSSKTTRLRRDGSDNCYMMLVIDSPHPPRTANWQWETSLEKAQREAWEQRQRLGVVRVQIIGADKTCDLDIPPGKPFVFKIRVLSDTHPSVEVTYGYCVVPESYELMLPFDEQKLQLREDSWKARQVGQGQQPNDVLQPT